VAAEGDLLERTSALIEDVHLLGVDRAHLERRNLAQALPECDRVGSLLDHKRSPVGRDKVGLIANQKSKIK